MMAEDQPRNRLQWIYLAFAAFFCVVGILQRVRWTRLGGRTNHFILFLPVMAFVALCVFSRMAKGRLSITVVFAFSFLAVGAWGFCTVAAELFLPTTAKITDVRQYEKVLNKRWIRDRGLISPFPRVIPAAASDVRFSFLPAYLQRGAHIQLRYSTNAEAIAGLHERFSKKATKSFSACDAKQFMDLKEGMPKRFFWTSGTNSSEFPDDYEIVILDPKPDAADGGERRRWYRQSHGVAISKKRSEIVYWAESW